MTISCPSSLSNNYCLRQLLDLVSLSSFVTSFYLMSHIVILKSVDAATDTLSEEVHTFTQAVSLYSTF